MDYILIMCAVLNLCIAAWLWYVVKVKMVALYLQTSLTSEKAIKTVAESKTLLVWYRKAFEFLTIRRALVLISLVLGAAGIVLVKLFPHTTLALTVTSILGWLLSSF